MHKAAKPGENRPNKIRPLYDQHGAEGYYRDHANAYENPHLPFIRKLLERNFHRLDCTGTVLDFAAGGGEVTLALQQLGAKNLAGCDPYTYELFEKKTGIPCLRHSFKDVIKNEISERYSLVISSFALHLCPPKELFPLTWNLLRAAPTLVVITPHKRPELEKLPQICLLWEDVVEDERGKKVRMKAYTQC
jgi:SAM-dependent methyltransferase